MTAEKPKKIAIISSYNEACGSAFYSSRLVKHLNDADNIEATVIRLDVRVLRATSKRLITEGNAHIRDICAQLSAYDAVCLQLEPGLYASPLPLAYRRLNMLFSAHSNILVTVHGFYALQAKSLFDFCKLLLRRQVFKAFRALHYRRFDRVTEKFWKKIAKMPNVKIHTFSAGDATYFKRYFNMPQVASFPITYYSAEEVNVIAQATDRNQILQSYNLSPDNNYLAVFGFLGAYKGHLIALKALEYLPDNYHLLIVGGEHPHGLSKGVSVSEYVRLLLSAINGDELLAHQNVPLNIHLDKKHDIGVYRTSELSQNMFAHGLIPQRDLRDRVHFIGQLSDEDMATFYHVCDMALHPYIETESGQSASGPAILALEMRGPSLFSNVGVFRNMENYFKGAMAFFSVGNYIELAQAIQRHHHSEPQRHAALEARLQEINPKRMIAFYLEQLGLS